MIFIECGNVGFMLRNWQLLEDQYLTLHILSIISESYGLPKLSCNSHPVIPLRK